MSSILKALQKLDRETADARQPHDPPHGPIRQLVPRKMAGRSRRLFIRRAALMLFAALFLGAVTWGVFRYPLPLPGRPAPQSRGAGSTIIEAAPAAPAGDASGRSPVSAPTPNDAPASRAGTAAAPTPARPAPAREAASPQTGTVRSERALPPAAKDRPATVQPKAAPPAAQDRNATVQPKAAPPAAGKKDHSDLPVKSQEEAGFSIQALVWSPVPEDRMVVVNGSILKEGGSIDGASVDYIGEDYVVVRKGGARWRLKFQLK